MAPPLVLASASPRRRQILARLGLPFLVEPSALAEAIPAREPEPALLAQALALAKAQAVARQEGIIVAADTLVVDEGAVLGKPRDSQEAAAMLRRLRGREHQVVSGVAVLYRGSSWTAAVASRVRLRPYSPEEMAAYAATGAPLDRAGAYGIQDAPFRPAAACYGCYLNVVGLPLCALVELLRPLGLALPQGVVGPPRNLRSRGEPLVAQDPAACPQCRAFVTLPADHQPGASAMSAQDPKA